MDSLNFSCQGESHIITGKVCQDYSYSNVYENGNATAIVCDGHGGKRYFRSDIGAKIAVEVTEQKVKAFIEEVGFSQIKGEPFTQHETISEQITKQDFDKTSNIERAFRQLFGSIIYEWNAVVLAHATQNPISDLEKEGLDESWIKEYEEKVNLEKVYGCTLIVYASTPDFWFAFQIGDGKCFACDSDGNWSEPIPWDDHCFLNKTTSICDSGAIDEFRYCYDGTGYFPIAVILGSDGIDDSFGSEENQANFYVQILKSIAKSGIKATRLEIETTLPQLSKIGSQDDMSIAMIVDCEKVKSALPNMIEWQIANVKRAIWAEDEKIERANKIQQSLENVDSLSRQDLINLQYANADEKRAIEAREKLQGRRDTLLNELTGNVPTEDNSDKENGDNTEVEQSNVSSSDNTEVNDGTE